MAITKKYQATSMSTDLDKLMLENYQYPSPDDENLQEIIFSKRDFHINKIYPQDESGDRLEQYRAICTATQSVKLTPTQIFVSKFINPRTPYRGLLLFHGTGTGKSLASIACAENFKPYVEKYGNRIHVLVPGALNKENFISEILKITGETYLKDFVNKTDVISAEEKEKKRREAVLMINQYYRIMTHRSFTKKVLGEKIKTKAVRNGKIKVVDQKTDDGEVERIFPVDRIFSLDNTLIIVDEAHGFTDNEQGEALKQIMDASHNLKLLLLSATPMKDSADSIVEMVNYLRPREQPIKRDKVFTSQKGHHIQFKPGGEKYLRKMVRGYVSYLRGFNPLTFADREDMGVIPPGLQFTKVIRCMMKSFQLETYRDVVDNQKDSFDRVSGAVSNFVWPGISKNDKLIGYYGIQGMSDIKNQLKANADKLTSRVCTELLDCDHPEAQSLLYLINNNRIISGDIYNERYLAVFSVKFHRALININENVYGKKGPGLVFVYSNLRQVGVELYQEVLKMNGYLEYQENASNYIILPATRCYFCGHSYGKHGSIPKDIPTHTFAPATFITVTGRSTESVDQIPEEKFRIITNVFTHPDNADGRHIKVILGSKVMNEGITLHNIQEIHVLDVHFNLGRVDQVIGRGIRFCKHYDIMNEDNLYPKVRIYKYVVSLTGGLSTEEEMYLNAEKKYVLVKKVERILQEEAVDCALNMGGNLFPSELKKHKDCGGKENPCPAICGYQPCQYQCGNKSLNAKYYDASSYIYRSIGKDKLDYTTYDISMATEEINEAKELIKTMYKTAHVFDLPQIIKRIKQSYPAEKKDLFDANYVYQALAKLLPVSENDFNNFHDTVTDKFNRPGYLIYRGGYYIFQPFDEHENLPMFYRRHYQPRITHKLDAKDFLRHSTAYEKYSQTQPIETLPGFMVQGYDFDSVQSYYDAREENEIVGIIDKESLKKRARNLGIERDEFKIRGPRPKVIEKKRQTGLPSFLGSACTVSKDRAYLAKIAKNLKLTVNKTEIRQTICDMIRDKLMALEKYSVDNITYMIIPANHPTIPWPLNLKDRISHIERQIKDATQTVPKTTRHSSTGQYSDIDYHYYTLTYDDNPRHNEIYVKHGAELQKGKYVIKIE